MLKLRVATAFAILPSVPGKNSLYTDLGLRAATHDSDRSHFASHDV